MRGPTIMAISAAAPQIFIASSFCYIFSCILWLIFCGNFPFFSFYFFFLLRKIGAIDFQMRLRVADGNTKQSMA